ncbi:hypothetical protein [Streptomyces sp. NPDC055056]
MGEWIANGYRTTHNALAYHPAVRPPHQPVQETGANYAAPVLLATTAEALRTSPELLGECFGPAALVITYSTRRDLLQTLCILPAGLTATTQGELGGQMEKAKRTPPATRWPS